MFGVLPAPGGSKADAIWSEADFASLGPANGTEMMTPFPVPIHKRFDETNKAVIRTKEKPSLPVPEKIWMQKEVV